MCKEYGIEISQEVDLKVNVQTDKVFYLNLPEHSKGELEEDELQKIAAGARVGGTFATFIVCGG